MSSQPRIAFFSRHCDRNLFLHIYGMAYRRKLRTAPFSVFRLCLYAEMLHRSAPQSPLFVYFFNSHQELIAQMPLHSTKVHEMCAYYPEILRKIRTTRAQKLAFSISGTRTDKHATALVEQLMLFCKTNHLALMEIAVCKEPIFYPFLHTNALE